MSKPYVDHIGVLVADMDKAVEMFRKLFKMDPDMTKDRPDVGFRIDPKRPIRAGGRWDRARDPVGQDGTDPREEPEDVLQFESVSIDWLKNSAQEKSQKQNQDRCRNGSEQLVAEPSCKLNPPETAGCDCEKGDQAWNPNVYGKTQIDIVGRREIDSELAYGLYVAGRM